MRRLALIAAGAMLIAAPAAAQTVDPQPAAPPPPPKLRYITLPGQAPSNQPVLSYAEIRFKGIERQSQDLSCGAAALATLLKYYFNLQTSEQTIIKDVLDAASVTDRVKISQGGFSMLELKRYAERMGLVAGGFKTEKATDLLKLKAPAIALVNSRGYNHFVVIRHVRGGEVAIADPVFGNRIEPLETFAKRWNYVILVVVGPGRVVNSSFMEAPNTIADPRAVQLYLSRHVAPSLIAQPGELY